MSTAFVRSTSTIMCPLKLETNMLIRVTTLLLMMLAITPFGMAHDYWLQPQPFVLKPGQTTEVRLFVGDHLNNESERSLTQKKTVRFQAISQKKAEDLKPRSQDGSKPVCTLTPQNAGNHLLVLERDWSHIELAAAKFNSYLDHEGLTNILKMRQKAGEDQEVGRERYRRYLKTLVQVGDTSDQTFAHKAGQRLEILLRTNPYTADVGDPIAATVVFDGKTLANAQVAAYSRHDGVVKTQEARTDAQGRVQFKLDRKGLWLIRLVHMQRCQEDPDYDWESFWGAYSFSLP